MFFKIKISRLGKLAGPGMHMAIPICLFAALMFWGSCEGPDYGAYLDWARTVLSGDIFKLRSPVLSPFGVPLSLWSPGPGLIFALGKMVSGKHGTDIVGWLGGMVFWWAFLRILGLAAGGDPALTVFGAAAAFLGTHAGVYSSAYGSELFAYPAAAVLILWTVSPCAFKWIDILIAGCAAGMLIMIRAQMVIYAIPALLVFAYRAVQSWREKAIMKKVADTGLLFLPLVVAIIQICWTNRWMTGDFWRSPYSFGSGSFRSLDWAHPEFSAVLTHPLNGLLVYHPLYGVCFLALALRIAQAGSRAEKLFCGVAGCLIFLNLYLYASWFGWWLGQSFGQRGMSVAAVLLVPVLVRAIGERQPGSLQAPLLVGLTLIACFWSYLMMCTGTYLSISVVAVAPAMWFYTYADLLAGMRDNLQLGFWLQKILVLGPAFALFWFARRKISGEIKETGAVEIAALFLAVLCFSYLILRAVSAPAMRGVGGQSPDLFQALLMLMEIASISAIVLCGYFLFRSGYRMGAALRPSEIRVAAGVVIVFTAAQLLFFNLAINTERKIAAGIKPGREFSYTAGYQLDTVRMTYMEYLRIPGFEEKKQKMNDFLLAAEIKQRALRSSPRCKEVGPLFKLPCRHSPPGWKRERCKTTPLG